MNFGFQNFPDELVKCGTHDSMKHYFLQTVKEADQMKHRGAVMSAMKVEEHGQLFQSIANGLLSIAVNSILSVFRQV